MKIWTVCSRRSMAGAECVSYQRVSFQQAFHRQGDHLNLRHSSRLTELSMSVTTYLNLNKWPTQIRFDEELKANASESGTIFRRSEGVAQKRYHKSLQPFITMNEPDLRMPSVKVHCLFTNSFISASDEILNLEREMVILDPTLNFYSRCFYEMLGSQDQSQAAEPNPAPVDMSFFE